MKITGYLFFVLICGFIFFNQSKLLGSKSNHTDNYQPVSDNVLRKFETGDIVLRNGKGFISDVFKNFSLHEKRFSHAGIVVVEHGRVEVYHIIGEENNGMKKELFSDFCNSNYNSAFAVYRYDFSAEQKQRMETEAKRLFFSHTKFDEVFDLSSDSKMYCTEMIYKIVEKVTGTKNYLPTSVLNNRQYIAPDNLYKNVHSTLIYETTYEN